MMSSRSTSFLDEVCLESFSRALWTSHLSPGDCELVVTLHKRDLGPSFSLKGACCMPPVTVETAGQTGVPDPLLVPLRQTRVHRKQKALVLLSNFPLAKAHSQGSGVRAQSMKCLPQEAEFWPQYLHKKPGTGWKYGSVSRTTCYQASQLF